MCLHNLLRRFSEQGRPVLEVPADSVQGPKSTTIVEIGTARNKLICLRCNSNLWHDRSPVSNVAGGTTISPLLQKGRQSWQRRKPLPAHGVPRKCFESDLCQHQSSHTTSRTAMSNGPCVPSTFRSDTWTVMTPSTHRPSDSPSDCHEVKAASARTAVQVAQLLTPRSWAMRLISVRFVAKAVPTTRLRSRSFPGRCYHRSA